MKRIIFAAVMLFLTRVQAQGSDIEALFAAKLKFAIDILFANGRPSGATLYVERVARNDVEESRIGVGFGAMGYCPDPGNGGAMFICTDWITAHVTYIPYGIPPKITLSPPPPPGPDGEDACGSIIDYSGRNVTEQISLDGTPFKISYSSLYNPLIAKNRKATVPNDFANKTHMFHKVQMSFEGSTQPPQEIIYNPYASSISSLEWDGITQNQSTNIFVSRTNVIVDFLYNMDFAQITETLAEEMEGLPVLFAPDVNNPPAVPVENVPLTVASVTGKIVIYHPEVWGMNGWTLDIHHFFDADSQTLYSGYGKKINYKAFKIISLPGYANDLIAVPDKSNPEEYYVFDMQGRHLETRSAKLKKAVYKFHYDNAYRLLKVEDMFGKFTEFVYDGNVLSKIVAPYGQETLVASDGQRILSVTNSLGRPNTMTYDSIGQLLTYKSLDGSTTTFTYDVEGNMLAESKDTGIVQTIANFWQNGTETVQLVHNWGAAIKKDVTSLMDRDIAVFKNNAGDVLATETVYKPVGGIYQHVYNENNTSVVTTLKRDHPFWGEDVTEVTSITTEAYSPLNNVIETNTTQIEYSFDSGHPDSLANQNVTQQSPTAGENSVYMNFLSRTFTVQLPTGGSDHFTYNENGQMTALSPHTSAPTQLTYDSEGRLIKSQKGTHFESYLYDQYGFVQSRTTSDGKVTAFVRDSQGKVLTQTLPNGEQIHTEYTDSGEIKKITTPGNQMHVFQMSLGDYLSGYLNPDGKNTQYIYDTDKRLTRMTKPSGKYMEYVYSTTNGQLQEIETDAGSYLYSDFDLRGRAKTLSSPDNIRLETVWLGDHIQQQKWFDADGVEVGSLSYGFESDRFRINHISINSVQVAALAYDSWLQKLLTLNGVSFSYQDEGAPTFRQTITTYEQNFTTEYVIHESENGDKPIQSVVATAQEGENLLLDIKLKREYDGFGQASSSSSLTRDSGSGVLHSYSELKPQYDLNNRLIQIQKNRRNFINDQEVSTTEFYNQYDFPAGSNNNLKEFRQVPEVSAPAQKRTVATHGADDRLLTLRGSINRDYAYTDDGDLLSMSNCYGEVRYEYDVAGNLKKMTLPTGKVIEYKVDGQNRRVKKLVDGMVREYYLWYDQLRIAAVLDENKEVKLTYLYGPESAHSPSYVIKNGVSYRILHDPGLGSIRYVVNPSTREIMQEIEYDEYGNMMKNTDVEFQPLGFAGGLWDADTKLIRFGARDYDPTVGRWTTKDPIGFAGGDTNLYGYVGQNPMSYNDPSGLATFMCIKPLDTLGGTGSKSGPDIDANPLFHQFICTVSNGKVVCGGQTHSGSAALSRGQNSGEAGMGGASCEEKEPDNKCLETCINNRIAGGRPIYSLVGPGSNCQEWANDTLAQCRASCGW